MRFIVVAALITAVAPKAQAQGAPAAAAVAANPKLAGTWEGNYTTDGPSGVMTLTLAKEASGVWKVTNTLGADGPAPGEPKDLTTDGSKVTWKQVFGEYDVTFTAALNAEGTQITGTLEATQGGASVGGGSYTLNRKT